MATDQGLVFLVGSDLVVSWFTGGFDLLSLGVDVRSMLKVDGRVSGKLRRVLELEPRDPCFDPRPQSRRRLLSKSLPLDALQNSET